MEKCRSILVVDDDPVARDEMRLAIQEERYLVFCASDGEEALKMLPWLTAPCLILLDLRMPNVDGWELARRLREAMDAGKYAIVVVSAYPESVMPLGVTRSLRKPVSPELLLDVVGEYVSSPRIQP